MSFEHIQTVNKRNELIKKYLKAHKDNKEKILSKKVAEEDFQRDVVQPLTQPIVQAVQMPLEAYSNQQLALAPPPQKAISPPPEDIEINLDEGIDETVLQKFNLPQLSSILAAVTEDNFLDTLNMLDAQTLELLKDLGRRKASARKDTAKREKIEYDLQNIRTYRNRIKSLVQESKIISKPRRKRQSSPVFGMGVRPKNPYKLTKDFMFGNLKIDPDQLLRLKLVAYQGSKKVLNKPIDYDFIELLHKRFNTKKQYSPQALATFKKLVELSGLPINQRSLKFTKVVKGCAPEDLANRLAVLTGSIEAGNKSKTITNEIVDIITKLLNNDLINKEEYKTIYENYVA